MEPSSSSNSSKCQCEKLETSVEESDSSTSDSSPKDKKCKIGLFNLRKNKHLHFPCKKTKKSSQQSSPDQETSSVFKKSQKWSIKFNCVKKEPKTSLQDNSLCCRCTCNRRTEENAPSTSKVVKMEEKLPTCHSSEVSEVSSELRDPENNRAVRNPEPQVRHVQIEQAEGVRGIYGMAGSSPITSNIIISAPFVDVQWMRLAHEDCDETARIARAREIEQGVEAPANFRSVRRVQLLCSDSHLTEGPSQAAPRRLQLVCPPDLSVESLRALFQNHVTLMSCPPDSVTSCHTQVDFIHCLVPDLLEITNCSFYWGKMDRYEAERLLDGKPEGTFLLRDSAQEEFLFSVSFRRYGRSLHARIEQWNHKFSFDSHDPGVFTCDTVRGLIEHYKDSGSCMFFEPMLTLPLHRKFTFSLQHLARAVIVSRLTYDNINHLQLPKTLKTYLKEYHYRQKVRVERFEDDVQWLELRNVSP